MQQAGQLVAHLLPGAVDVRVVLGHAAHPGQTVHDAGLLVAVDRAELEEPQRQFAVGPSAGAEDQAVQRAVHRLEVVVLAGLAHVAVLVELLVEVHRREHAVRVPVQVAGDLEQVGLGDVRGVDELVPGLDVPLPGVVLHLLADDAAPGVEHRQPRADLVREENRSSSAPSLRWSRRSASASRSRCASCASLRLPGGAVDALQLRVLLVPRQYAAELRVSLKAGMYLVVGTCGPRHRSLHTSRRCPRVQVVVDGQLVAADLHDLRRPSPSRT